MRKNRRIEYIGIPFIITNYRKCVFFAIFRDRSGAVRQVQQPSRSQKIIKKCALFGAKHFCGEEIAACGVVFARQTPEIVLAVL